MEWLKLYPVDRQYCSGGNHPEVSKWSQDCLAKSLVIPALYTKFKLISHKFNIYMAGIVSDLAKNLGWSQFWVVSRQFPPGKPCWSTQSFGLMLKH